MIDATKLKTFEDALCAIDEIDLQNDPDAVSDAHAVAEWIWHNCDHGNDEVVLEVYLFADEGSELMSLAGEKYFERLFHS